VGDQHKYSEQRLKELSWGYGLDGGGYEFENSTWENLEVIGAVVWESPDPDYVPWVYNLGDKRFHDISCPIYAFIPQSGFGCEREWPQRLGEDDPESYQYRLVATGMVQETDRECDCHGKWVPEDNDFWKASWQLSGSPGDDPHPKCPRCEGSGYVNSSAGQWAVYEEFEVEEEDAA
jgi:hypothetical protein